MFLCVLAIKLHNLQLLRLPACGLLQTPAKDGANSSSSSTPPSGSLFLSALLSLSSFTRFFFFLSISSLLSIYDLSKKLTLWIVVLGRTSQNWSICFLDWSLLFLLSSFLCCSLERYALSNTLFRTWMVFFLSLCVCACVTWYTYHIYCNLWIEAETNRYLLLPLCPTLCYSYYT